MTRIRRPDEDFRKDFADSVFVEELDSDSIPAELMAEFESSGMGHLTAEPLLDIDLDIWSSEVDASKREFKR